MDQDNAPLDHQPQPIHEIVEALNDLLQLDHDAIGAYEIAIEKLEDRAHAGHIAGFRSDHERHIRDLNALIEELGGVPRNEPHATGPLKQALQSLGAMAGDRGVLLSFRTNERQVRAKYDGYVSRAAGWPERVRLVVESNALDEGRHYGWVDQTLGALGEGAAAGVLAGGATLSGAGAGALGAGVTRSVGAVANRIAHLVDADSVPVTRLRDAGARVAEGVGGTSRYLRGARLPELREGVADRVRETPLRTLLIAAVAGFTVGRLFR